MTGEIRSTRARRGILKVSSGLLLAAALSAPAFGPGQALAYEKLGFRWAHPGLTFGYIHNSRDNTDVPSWDDQHINSAAASWSRTPTPVSIVKVAPGATPNVTIMAYTTYDGYGGHGNCDGRDGQGYCNHGTITLWFGYGPNNSAGSLENTPQFDEYEALHEMGHVFGLDHSCVSAAVMSGPNQTYCPKQSYDTTWPTIPTQDDIDGLNSIYPGTAGSGGGCAPANTPVPAVGGATQTDPLALAYEATQTADKALEATGVSIPDTGLPSLGHLIGAAGC